MKREEKVNGLIFCVVLGVALIASIAFQGSRGLYDRDETRYSECAREMLCEGSWLVPLRGFRPHLTKPPITYWAIATGLKTIGVNEWGARLPNAVAFSITVILVGLAASRLFGLRSGVAASLVYLTSIVPFAASNIVTTDTILVMWEVAAIWAFLGGVQSKGSGKALAWFSLMAVFWGLGFLTKGPAIFPVAAAPALYWLLRRKDFRAFPAHPIPVLIFLATGLSWYVLIVKRYPWALNMLITEQVTGRLFSDVFHRNSFWYAPFYIYLPLVLLGSLPWALWFPGIIRQYTRGHNFKENVKRFWQLLMHDDSWLFILLWWAVPLVVFSLASSRLPLYILPVFAPMAIWAARFTLAPLPLNLWPKRVLVPLFVFILIKWGAAFVPAPQDARCLYRAFSPYLGQAKELNVIGEPFLDGLSFYTQKPVKYIKVPDRTLDPLWSEKVEELQRGGSKFFIIKIKKMKRTKVLGQHGLNVRLIRRYHQYGLLKLWPKV